MDLEITVERLARPLLRYCLGISGDPSLAEELAQDALTALVQSWQRHGSPRDPAAFVFIIARRRAARARLKRRIFRPLELIRHRPDPGPGPELDVVRKQELEHTVQSLDALSTKERDALLLIVAGDLTGKQASEVLGISHSAFKMRVLRARHKLARITASPMETSDVRTQRV